MKTLPAILLKTEYVNEVCDLRFAQYANAGELAVVAESALGGPLLKLSCCLSEVPPKSPSCAWVKTWSENAGLLEWLEDHPELGRFTGRAAMISGPLAFEFDFAPALARASESESPA